MPLKFTLPLPSISFKTRNGLALVHVLRFLDSSKKVWVKFLRKVACFQRATSNILMENSTYLYAIPIETSPVLVSIGMDSTTYVYHHVLSALHKERP